jgi:hypothetical protein
MSAILTSRFLLNLRYMSAHTNCIGESTSLPTFQAAIISDFGDPTLSYSLNQESELEGIQPARSVDIGNPKGSHNDPDIESGGTSDVLPPPSEWKTKRIYDHVVAFVSSHKHVYRGFSPLPCSKIYL